MGLIALNLQFLGEKAVTDSPLLIDIVGFSPLIKHF